MSLIRNVMIVLAAGVMAGCQYKKADPPTVLNTQPLAVDEAMQRRDWDKTTAYYRNGGVESNADRFPLQSRVQSPVLRSLSEVPIFLANTVMLPVTYIGQRPGTVVSNQAVVTEATYTAVPPAGGSGVTQDYAQQTPQRRTPIPPGGGSTGSGNSASPGSGAVTPSR